jgi:hypothetical protein
LLDRSGGVIRHDSEKLAAMILDIMKSQRNFV